MGMVLSIVQFPLSKLHEYIKYPNSFKADLRDLEKNKIDRSVYLDKSWEVIHLILTGNRLGYGTPPLSLAIFSRQFFDEKQDLGMGPASYLTPDQVKEIHSSLEIQDEEYVKEKYDRRKMTELKIYHHPSDDNPLHFKYFVENFQKLKSFYEEAASKGHAVASYLG